MRTDPPESCYLRDPLTADLGLDCRCTRCRAANAGHWVRAEQRRRRRKELAATPASALDIARLRRRLRRVVDDIARLTGDVAEIAAAVAKLEQHR